MTNKDWTEDLARKLAQYERKAPEGLLDEVHQEMARRAEAAPMKVVSRTNRRRWAVAASIAVLIAGGLSFWLLQPSETGGPTTQSKQVNLAQNATVEPALKEEPGSPLARIVQHLPIVNHALTEPNTPDALLTQADEPLIAEAAPAPEQKAPTEQFRQQPQPEEKPAETELLASESPTPETKKKKRHRVRVSLLAGGMGSFSDGIAGNGIALADAAPFGPFSNEMATASSFMEGRSAATEPREEKHHHPLRTGISVNIPLSKRWNLQTGVTYSYLRSEFKSGPEGAQTRTKQRLHYVGVPVGASYSIWQKGPVAVYARGGGEIQKLVSGKSTTTDPIGTKTKESVKEGRPQFSVNAAVGAEVNTGLGFSIYAEPGATYHFDNGSSVSNIYKDKKLSPSLNIGFRINTGR